MRTAQLSILVLACISCGVVVAGDNASPLPYPEVSWLLDASDRSIQEVLIRDGLSIGSAGENGVLRDPTAKCDGPFNKLVPACNHKDLDFFPVEAECPGDFAIVTGGSGGCQVQNGVSLPLVDFYGDDWGSFWPGAKGCRTQDHYAVMEFQQDGTSGLTVSSTTLWQMRPWVQSGKPLPKGLDPALPWMEAQCSGWMEMKSFGYNGN